MTHFYYDIVNCQWDEAVYFTKKRIYIEGENKLTFAELRYIVELAKDNYENFGWKKENIDMEDLFRSVNLFSRLHNGEQIKCTTCGKGFIKPMGNGPIEKECCFECDNCKAHYRYDPVNVIVE